MDKLKTLKDIDWYQLGVDCIINNEDKHNFVHADVDIFDLRQEAIKTIHNLRTNETISPLLIDKFPDTMKGSSIEKSFEDGIGNLCMEYGMIMMLMYFFNITEEDLK